MIKQQLINTNKYEVKCPYQMNPVGICIHNTANDASAQNERNNVNRVDNNSAVSFHIAVDDIEAIQLIPFDRNAWHAGDGGSGQGNRKHIAIEICYSKTGGERFINAEKRAAKVVAKILKDYNWGIDRVKKHKDFSNKYCPHRTLDMGWNRFINMVQGELNGESIIIPTPLPPQVEEKPKPTQEKKYLFLNAHVSKWNVYPINVAPVIGNQCGSLAPSQYGGLEYEILGNPQTDVYTIQTESFGRVNIYVPKDNDSKFYTKGGTVTPPTPPVQSNKKYLNLHKHNATWRVYPLNKSATIGNEVGSLAPATYCGLSYEILEDKGDIKIITTESFGRVQIYAPRDADSSITSNPLY